MLDFRKSLINSTLHKVLQRLHYPLEVMLTSYGQKTPSASGERLGRGVWVVITMRYGCLRWFERLGAGLAAVAVNRAALIWELVWMDFLTLRDTGELDKRIDAVMGQVKAGFAKDTAPTARATLKLPAKA